MAHLRSGVPGVARPRFSSLVAQQPAFLAAPVALLFDLALVVQLLAAREREAQLRPAAIVEIDAQRHDRHALALDRLRKLRQLALLEQKLPQALGLVVEAIARLIFGDRRVDEPSLALAVDMRVALGDRRLAGAQRFDLRAGQREAGVERLAELVIEARLAIFGDDLEISVGTLRHDRTYPQITLRSGGNA